MRLRFKALTALLAVLLLTGSAMASQFRFVGKHRDDGRFIITLCQTDGGRVFATLIRPDGRLICGPILTDRRPDRVLEFRCPVRGRDLLLRIIATPHGLFWKLQRGDECVSGPLCPIP